MFIDFAKIQVQAGRGGRGCCSFRREAYVPKGGPDGGNGGKGGDIVIQADPAKRTLLDFRYQRNYKAHHGGHGLGKNMYGRSAPDLIIQVPAGTIIRDEETGEIYADLVDPNQTVVIAKGGDGGRGNSTFKSATNQSPRRVEEGWEGETRSLELELKLLADVGLVGHPNAGKSTLLSRLSAARPKIADYPFTTLEPNLGIVRIGDYDSFVMADIPGLIEGAHTGKGLGIQFLRHIERTRILLFLLDVSSEDPWHDYDVLRDELGQFNPVLLKRPSMIAFTKQDLLIDLDPVKELMAGQTPSPLLISSATGEGIPKLIQQISDKIYEIDRADSD
jgi:GTPase